MARRPVPIFVVPKSGVTVLLDGVVVPAEGLETTVDDEVANELLEGTLDDYPVPYHPPPDNSGTAAGVQAGLSGAATGSMRIAGTAAGAQGGLVGLGGGTSGTSISGAGVGVQSGLTGSAAGAMRIGGSTISYLGTSWTAGLDLSANQPPSSVAIPSFMQGGRWRFTFTQTSRVSGGSYALFHRGDGSGGASDWARNSLILSYSSTFGNTALYFFTPFGAVPNLAFFEYALNTPVSLDIDMVAGTCTISGAISGNGVKTLGASLAWPAGTMGVGKLITGTGGGGVVDFAGTFSNVDQFVGSLLTGAASGSVGSLTAVSGTAAGSQAGLVGAATSLPDPGVGNALLIDSSGNYLLNAAGDYLYGRQ